MRLDLDIILPSLLAAGIILLVSFPVHEFSHAWAAYRLGDGTAKLFGRLTLNPIVHFDPLGGFLLLVSSLIGVGIGWAKPTPVNPINLRGGRRSEGLVAAAGPLSNLVLAVFGGILFRPLFANYQRRNGHRLLPAAGDRGLRRDQHRPADLQLRAGGPRSTARRCCSP